MPEGHGSFSGGSRTPCKRRADFFRELVSGAHSVARGAAAWWAVALNAGPRNNLYGKRVRVDVCAREREREREREISLLERHCA